MAAEFRFGGVKKRSKKLQEVIDGILSRLAVVALDEPADVLYAELRDRLEARGEKIGGNDMLIAAHALAFDLTLVTDNVREFERVERRRIENWLNQS